jgi:hypothetical protein
MMPLVNRQTALERRGDQGITRKLFRYFRRDHPRARWNSAFWPSATRASSRAGLGHCLGELSPLPSSNAFSLYGVEPYLLNAGAGKRDKPLLTPET